MKRKILKGKRADVATRKALLHAISPILYRISSRWK